MQSLLRLLWDLCRFRRGPQDLPYSIGLARALILAEAGASLLYLQFLDQATDRALLRLGCSLILAVGLPWLILRVRQREARYVQTLTALVGTAVLFTIAYLPLAAWEAKLPEFDPAVPPTAERLALAWLTLGLVAWKLAINAHVWHHALDWPKFGGVLLAVGVFVVELGLLRLVSGA